MQAILPQKFEVNADFINKYHGKRIEVRCVDGDILTGCVGWINEDDLDDLGFDLNDVEANGEKLSYKVIIPESQVSSFIVLLEV
ncbi:MAG: hypothetical protein LBT08_09430 [Synergistaceae bacterium]|nr:hypothetical protein [Synergistaceae bacterium]